MKKTPKYFLLLQILLGFGLQSCKKETDETKNLNPDKSNLQMPSIRKGNSADSINYNETSTKKSDEEILKEQEKREKESEKIIKKFKIDKKGNGFVYQIFCEEQKSNLINFRKIKILKSGQLIQTIPIAKDSAYVYNVDEIDFASDKDWNFDGNNDIMLVNWHGMVDATYYLWLFDENSGKYVFCPSFSKIKTPGLDKEKKEIVSEYHIGPSHFYYEKYKWRNGKFVMTYSKSEGEEF